MTQKVKFALLFFLDVKDTLLVSGNNCGLYMNVLQTSLHVETLSEINRFGDK